jgi:ADP-ribosylglycohydrolase
MTPSRTAAADRGLSRADRLAGAVVGLALGDALGAPVEAQSPAAARAYVDAMVRPGLIPVRGPAGFPFGQVTDDTQLAVELLRTLAEHGDLQPAAFAARVAALVAAGRLVGGGPATRTTAERLAQGIPWTDAGMDAPYAGNGAAMRAAPLGVIYGEPGRLREVAAAQARVTHRNPRCAAGAVAVAWAAAVAARRQPIDVAAFLAEGGQVVAPVDPGFGAILLQMRDWAARDPDDAVRAVTHLGLEPETGNGWRGISSGVTASVCWSLYAFLRSPDDFAAAVCDAIAVGGDTDTMAAMTGALVGARLGLGALPAHLVARLTDRQVWTVDELVMLAHQVAQSLSG